MKPKRSVLFLCTDNSARSQMAEALLKDKASDQFEVYSAGTHPEQVDVRTIKALQQLGIETKNLVSKNASDFLSRSFDFVITLCDSADTLHKNYPNAVKQLAWDFPDPKSRSGSSPFLVTLQEMSNRILMFTCIEQLLTVKQAVKATDKKSAENSTSLLQGFNPTDFYKCLTDDIRLKTLMLTYYHGELCVCELMQALAEASQPKVSRNLAVLKKAQVIVDRKHGQWVFYRINPQLPLWAKLVIGQSAENNIDFVGSELQRLDNMNDRPGRASFCR
jgi:ArsR family transcriptional regulator